MNKQNAKPLVTIVIPVYNGSNYLHESIQSALAQTYQPIEIIVVNDGSNDVGKTEAIAQSYGDKIRYFTKENGGVGSALNLAIREMKGAFFSWLSHDDLYLPHKIETQIKHLHSLSDQNVVLYSDFSLFSDHPDDGQIVKVPSMIKGRARYHIMMDSFVHGCSLLIPKAVFDRVGVFDERLRMTQDYDLWFRIAKHVHFEHCSHVLVQGRCHQDQTTHRLPHLAESECNALKKNCVETILPSELEEAMGCSAALAYAHIAAKMWRCNLPLAAIAARKLVFRNKRSMSLFDVLFAARLLLMGPAIYQLARIRTRMIIRRKKWRDYLLR
jgi:glycosyltransferase involved in cell wall biosynthesis